MPRTSGTRVGNGAGLGGPASGPGWGGSAKGAGSGGSPKAFQAGNEAAAGHAKPDLQKLKTDAERIAALKEHLLFLSMYADRQETQVAAARAMLDRLEGMPVQRTHLGQDKEALPLGVVILPAKAEA